MLPELIALVEIQQMDKDIKEIETANVSLNKQLEKEKEEIAKKKIILQEMVEKKDTIQKDLRHNERMLQQIEQNLEGFEKKIYQVKSQKELEAVDHEIAKSRKERSSTEDVILICMTSIEEISGSLSKQEKELKKETDDFNCRSQKIEADIDINTQRLLKANTKKQEIITTIEPTLLANYERLREGRNNIAIVHVEGGICQGCFITLPPQQVNEIRIGNSIIRCASCSRMLYWKG
ncbi:MAG: C4-type zinc ribbon domain-containing protein [bacterium]|nr:C4-type zinc ribbon domain-containing protein [bacterium]